MREDNPAARLPAPAIDVIRAIFYKCLRKWSTNAPSFEHFIEATPADYRQARHFKGESLLLEISEGVYCFTQKIPTGPLHRMTKKEAKDVIQLHQKKSWTWKQCKRAQHVHFTTPESCYPCHIWASRRICYHQIAVGSLVGSCDIPHEDDDDVLMVNVRRGRPKRKRAEFTSERLFNAAAKRKRKRKN